MMKHPLVPCRAHNVLSLPTQNVERVAGEKEKERSPLLRLAHMNRT